MAKKQKYYVVWEGNNPGVYDNWTDCQLQIKSYPGAKYKAFTSREEAVEAFRGNFGDLAAGLGAMGSPAASTSPRKPTT